MEYIVVALVLMLVILIVLYVVGGNLVPGFKSAVDGILKNVGFVKTTSTAP
ncbi:MAG: hypothetical protein HY515_03475 [Candidatus Aenigmarchaeota archaeon]|nr:hypothetical protein [Candidatus Aenigmarchaeota archaeon]